MTLSCHPLKPLHLVLLRQLCAALWLSSLPVSLGGPLPPCCSEGYMIPPLKSLRNFIGFTFPLPRSPLLPVLWKLPLPPSPLLLSTPSYGSELLVARPLAFRAGQNPFFSR